MGVPAHIRDGIVVGFATGVFAVGFGVLATTNGLSVAQTSVMSLLIFTGASQFAAVGVIAAGGSAGTAVSTALLLAARNGFYGITMSRLIRGSLPKRIVAAHVTIDESTGMAMAQTDPAKREGAFWAAGLGVFVFWNLGTLLGALAGDVIGDPERWGIDAAFPAGFIALMVPALKQRPGLLAAAAGGAIALVTIPLTRPGVPIILASIGAVIALVVAGPLDELSTPEDDAS